MEMRKRIVGKFIGFTTREGDIKRGDTRLSHGRKK